MKLLYFQFSLLLRRILWLMLFYSILRILFFLFNTPSFQTISYAQLIDSFILGLRFDLSAICIINILYVLGSFMLSPSRWEETFYQKILQNLFVIPNLAFLSLGVIDLEYYKFIGRRTNFEINSIMGDAVQQAPNLLGKYWYLGIIMFVLSWIFIKFLPKPSKGKIQNSSVPWYPFNVFVSLFIAALCILGFRGGLQEKPLRINQAFSQNNHQLGNLVLNTPFTFLTTIDAQGTSPVQYVSQQEMNLLISRNRQMSDTEVREPQNVMVVIVESLSAEYMGIYNQYTGYTPFLDSLGRAGVCMRNHFANGRESIDAVPAVLASMPKLMDEPYITSKYQANNLPGLANILKRFGYSSAFFHGARNGSMGFEGFSQMAGFQQYYGLNEYPNKKDFDGNWGIFDEPFLQFCAQKTNEQKQPFINAIFTLSSHSPYTIPTKYVGRFRKGPLEIHESIGYADYALSQFFESIKHTPWFKNTLFVITGDHTQQSSVPKYNNEIGAYRVPLILFHGSQKMNVLLKSKIVPNKITQHADIVPSILDFLDKKYDKLNCFGESIFNFSQGGTALLYSEGRFRMLSNAKYVVFDGEKFRGDTVNLEKNVIIKNNIPVSTTLKKKLLAFIQYHHNGLINNRL
ncbi:MAG: LTA synthase family protein [Flectobacillus sp.]|uniref:LTA synthase family protein n=1 Tax=Flectobacillus sp. TaxID=50419 RepID=UPI003B997639